MEKILCSSKMHERIESLCPIGTNGKRVPRKYRLYDHPTVGDRYTLVWTGNFKNRDFHQYGVGFNSIPYSHNMGIYQHFCYDKQIDYPSYKHLGKKIKFESLPESCQYLLMDEYLDLWGLPTDINPYSKDAR